MYRIRWQPQPGIINQYVCRTFAYALWYADALPTLLTIEYLGGE